MNLSSIPNSEIARLYNAVADKPVARFSDRNVGLRRLEAILAERGYQVVEDEVGLSVEPVAPANAWSEIEDLPAAAQPKTEIAAPAPMAPVVVEAPRQAPELTARAVVQIGNPALAAALRATGLAEEISIVAGPSADERIAARRATVDEPLEHDAAGMADYIAKLRAADRKPGQRVLAPEPEIQALSKPNGMPRAGSKNAIMLSMVTTEAGATEAEICERIGWKACSVTLKRACVKAGLTLSLVKVPGERGRYVARPAS